MNMPVTMNIFLVALVLGCTAIPIAIFLAKVWGLVDQPDLRKRHQVSTPLVGGICIYFVVVATKALYPMPELSWTLMGWFGLVLAVGVIDDLVTLSPRLRLLIHALTVIGIFATDFIAVQHVGAIYGRQDINFDTTSTILLFTIIGVVGAVNTINMIDGVDGLLGSIALLSLIAIALLAIDRNENHYILALIGSICAFLIFNCRFFGLERARVFLGDAGSTTIGFMLVYLLIRYSQGQNEIFSPVVAGWILGIPMLDASAVIVIRLINRQSPFAAARDHIHHLLIDRGMSVNKTVSLIIGAHALMLSIAVVVNPFLSNAGEAILFWTFVMLVVCRVCVTLLLPSVQLSNTNSSTPVTDIIGIDSLQTTQDRVKRHVDSAAVTSSVAGRKSGTKAVTAD